MKKTYPIRLPLTLLLVLLVHFFTAMAQENAFTVEAHRPIAVCLEVTNATQRVQTIVSVRSSCACLEVPQAVGRAIPVGKSVVLEARFNPRGLSGHVEKTIAVRLDPSGTEVVFHVEADVRVRCGLSPCEVLFGAGGGGAARMHVDLCGYATADGSSVRVTEIQPPENPAFKVTRDPDGRGVMVSFDRGSAPLGLLAETWHVLTNDKEVHELALPISACVQASVDVAPPQIVVERSNATESRVVTLRNRRGQPELRQVSVAAKPRVWGKTVVEQSALGGWRIVLSGIDFDVVRQFSHHPYLEVRTDVPGAETIIIPLHVVNGKE